MHDIRFALRSLLRQPGYLLVVVVTLALGIGANTAIFSVFNAVVLRRLPYPEPREIVRIRGDRPFTLEEMEAFQNGLDQLQAVSGFSSADLTLTGDGQPEKVSVGVVSSTHFEVLGVQPVVGRGFVAEDHRPGAQGVAVLSHGLWQRRFGGDEGILGQPIALRGQGREERTVVGVMPAGYRPLDADWQAWVPQAIDRSSNAYLAHAKLFLIGRLASDVSPAVAAEGVASIVARLMEEEPQRNLTHVRLLALHEDVVGDMGRTLAIMMGAVGLVLLIACANVANLLLARAEKRVHETAVRASLGAGRGRLVRQLLTESLTLGLVGGLVGLGSAWITVAALRSQIPASVPRTGEIGVDLSVLGFTLVVSVLCGVLFGLAPAVRLSRTDVQSGLREGGGSKGVGFRGWLNGALVAGEIALCLALAVGAGLMLKSLWQLNRIDAGFRTERLLTLHPLPPDTRYPEQTQRREYFRRVTERIATLPGVEAVEGVFPLPMTRTRLAVTYEAEGHPLGADDRPPYGDYNAVTAGYFEALGIPVLEGRGFTDHDRAGSEEVGIVNQSLARRLWPGESAVGKKIRWADNPWFTVVGVVGDVRQHGLEAEPTDMIYRPYSQDAWLPTLYLVVRTQGDPTAVLPDLRRAVWSIDDEVPLTSVQTMAQRIAGHQSDARFFTLLLVLAGAVALGLGAVGVYGVMSLAVSRRQQEYGIRMALGATQRDILHHALGRGILPVVAGLGLGLGAALAFNRVLASLLYEVTTSDPMVLAGTVGVLAFAALAAVYLPARRAAGTQPREVLQVE